MKIENEHANMKNQMQTLLTYIVFKENVPKDLVTMVVGLAHPSVNEV